MLKLVGSARHWFWSLNEIILICLQASYMPWHQASVISHFWVKFLGRFLITTSSIWGGNRGGGVAEECHQFYNLNRLVCGRNPPGKSDSLAAS